MIINKTVFTRVFQRKKCCNGRVERLHRVYGAQRCTIMEHAGDQKQIFQIADQLLHIRQVSPLPDSDSDKSLANQFFDYFTEKIWKIRKGFDIVDNWGFEEPKTTVQHMTSFEPATEDEILAIIRKAPSKSCEFDPVPTSLLKKSASEIVPIITKIVNTSLQNGVFSEALKVAHVRPLLKKQNLDRNIFKNYYRPVSNLTFLGKTIERVVLARLAPFMQEHDLTEEYQSAYRAFHSTETALLRVPNDVLCAMNQEKIMLLVLLDLSAAFDTVDHDVLFQRQTGLVSMVLH